MPDPKRLLVLTGDHSADGHAAAFIRALREADPAWHVAGVGGGSMAAEHIELIDDHRHMNVIGLGGVIKAVPSHRQLATKILDWVDRNKPDVAVLVDYGVFHLWLAPRLRARGVPVLYFIPPQIWASRPWRLKKLRRAADRVLCILPFEETYYREHGVPATFVGNPLVARLPPAEPKESFAARHGLDAGKTLIGLFPGSRKLEIRHLLAAQLGAARELERRAPGQFQFVLCKAKNLKRPFFDEHVAAGGGAAGIPNLLVTEENHALLSACDLALAASGTLTLEATLYRTPMVVMYRGPWYLYQLSRVLRTVEHIALPNNLAKRRIVPELWQYDVNPASIADAALAALEPVAYATMKGELDAVARQFADADTPRRVAQAIAELAERSDAPALVPSPGTPGEGEDEGDLER